MHARVTQFSAPPEHEQGVRRAIEDHIIPSVTEQPGFCGGLLMGNPKDGRMLAVTLWESEQHLRAHDEHAFWYRTFGAEEAGAEVESVEVYEVYRVQMLGKEPG